MFGGLRIIGRFSVLDVVLSLSSCLEEEDLLDHDRGL